MAKLIVRDNTTRQAYSFEPDAAGYAAYAAKKAEIESQGHGVSDDGTGSLSRNASFQVNTGNAYNSGNPANFDAPSSFFGLFGL